MDVILWIVALAVVALVAWALGRGGTKKRYEGALERTASAAREGDADAVRRAGAGSALPGLRAVKEVLLGATGSTAPARPESGESAPAAGAARSRGGEEDFVRSTLERISSYLREGVEEPLRAGIGGDGGALRGHVEDALVAVEDLDFYLRGVPEGRTTEDLNELAREAVDEYRSEWDSEIDVHVPERPTTAEVNREAMLDALYLVLHNAGTFGGERAEVVVRYQDGDCWIVVRDEGPGFSSEALERAFEPFYSTSDLGLGLGLHHVRKIVHAMNGRIALRNRPRGGAQVEIVLPEAE